MADSELRKHKAYHEAGHAVLAYKLVYPRTRPNAAFKEVTIEDPGSIGGIPRPHPEGPEEIELQQLALCGGFVTEKLFFDHVGDIHEIDWDSICELEMERQALQQPPEFHENGVADGRPRLQWDQPIDKLVKKAIFHLDSPKWKRLIQAVANKLLIHKELDFGQFVEIAIEQFGAEALPYPIYYLRKCDDGSPWTASVNWEDKTFDNVLVVIAYQPNHHYVWKELNDHFPELARELIKEYLPKPIDDQDSALSFLREHCAGTIEHMTINPKGVEGQLHAVCVHRISSLLGGDS